jgi:NhaP-type Na+/H+ or K+/H+ antiporter
VPSVALDPELALALFLPPLLQVSAYRTDWPAFRSNLRPVLLPAIGAVLFTTAAVALVAHLLVPGYLGAEALHASGVLAAVVCGLVLGRKQHAEFSARTRLELHAVWNFIEFLPASLIFMLIGLQMQGIVERLARESAKTSAASSGCS